MDGNGDQSLTTVKRPTRAKMPACELSEPSGKVFKHGIADTRGGSIPPPANVT